MWCTFSQEMGGTIVTVAQSTNALGNSYNGITLA